MHIGKYVRRGTEDDSSRRYKCPTSPKINSYTAPLFYLVCEAIGTAATPGLLCQPRVIVTMIVEKQMEYRLVVKTEVLGENLPQRHFCPSQNPTWPDPGLKPDRRGGKPGTNRLSYGAAVLGHLIQIVILWILLFVDVATTIFFLRKCGYGIFFIIGQLKKRPAIWM
jgi:hypothetical protein